MKSKKIILENESGLHARPAAELAKLAAKYACNIELVVNEKKINAKSVIAIMAAGIKESTQIEIICDGQDEDEALIAIEEGFKNKLRNLC